MREVVLIPNAYLSSRAASDLALDLARYDPLG